MHWNIHGKYNKQSSPMTHLDHKDPGWFPNPKGEYTEFWNAGSILPKFYVSFWTTCPYKECFRHCFVAERKRQLEVHETSNAINHKLAFVTRTAAGAETLPPSKYGWKRAQVERIFRAQSWIMYFIVQTFGSNPKQKAWESPSWSTRFQTLIFRKPIFSPLILLFLNLFGERRKIKSNVK